MFSPNAAFQPFEAGDVLQEGVRDSNASLQYVARAQNPTEQRRQDLATNKDRNAKNI